MAKKPETKGWAEECVEGVKTKVPVGVRATLEDQLKGVMQERPLKSSELAKLATAMLEPTKEAQAEEKAT